jgi:hypothetical protein
MPGGRSVAVAGDGGQGRRDPAAHIGDLGGRGPRGAGAATSGLLDSYDAERRPVGEEVVGRTVRHARAGFESNPDDPATVIMREAQLLVGYPDSPLVSEDVSEDRLAAGPRPGQRAPDCRGLRRDAVSFPMRLFELLRAPGTPCCSTPRTSSKVGRWPRWPRRRLRARVASCGRISSSVRRRSSSTSPSRPCTMLPASTGPRTTPTPSCAYLIRPDGYVGYRAAPADPTALARYLDTIFA